METRPRSNEHGGRGRPIRSAPRTENQFDASAYRRRRRTGVTGDRVPEAVAVRTEQYKHKREVHLFLEHCVESGNFHACLCVRRVTSLLLLLLLFSSHNGFNEKT